MIVAGFTFIAFILSRIKSPIKSEVVQDLRSPQVQNLVVFKDNKPSSCTDSDTTSTVSVIISADSSSVSHSCLTRAVYNVIGNTESSLLEEVIITSAARDLPARLKDVISSITQKYSSLVKYADRLSFDNKLTNKFLVAQAVAKGSVLVFLDETVLVSAGYLTPLLHALSVHPQVPQYFHHLYIIYKRIIILEQVFRFSRKG